MMDMFDRIIAREGGDKLTNIKGDDGGWTKFGISSAAHPTVDIKSLTYDEAKKIYQEEYFKKNNIHLLPVELQEAVLDFCVHSGAYNAIRYLQKIIGTTQDGVIGTQTVVEARKFATVLLLDAYRRERLLFLARQVVNKPEKMKFLIGWLNRALSL